MLKLKIPPPGYMLIFAGCMWLLNQHLPLMEIVSSPWNKMGLVVIATALSLDLSSLFLFFRRKTSPNPFNPNSASKLVTTGMYQYTRNPMYVGLALLLTGWAVFLGSLSPFLLIPLFIVVLNVQQIIPEEQVLETKFGDNYLDYKQSVRRWL